MTDDKKPTPEAMTVAFQLEAPDYDFALALDAFGEALLRRQTEERRTLKVDEATAAQFARLRSELAAALTASQGYFAKWQDCEAELAAEMAAHEEYRTKGQQHLADLKLSVDRYLREMAEEKAAHEATRKGLTQAHELLEAAQSDRDAALAELKATKARLDQWRLHFDAVRAKLDALRKELAAEQRNRIAQHGAYVATLAELEATKAELVSMTRDRDEWVGIAVERKTEREATRKAHERMAADWADAGRSLRSELTFRSGVISELNAKLEALRKPLEGGIEERISELYRHLEDAPTWSKSANEALDAIVAALRAKGEPQVVASWADGKYPQYAALAQEGEPQAVELAGCNCTCHSVHRVGMCTLCCKDPKNHGEPAEPRPSLLRPAVVAPAVTHPGPGPSWPREPKTRGPVPQRATSAATDDEPEEPSKREKSEGMVLTADTYVAANSETGERARIVATVPRELVEPAEPRPIVVGSTWKQD
jgi:hypothetical protein